MKSLLLIALSLVTVTSFANEHASKEDKKAAMEACKEIKDKKEHKTCVQEKLKEAAAAHKDSAKK